MPRYVFILVFMLTTTKVVGQQGVCAIDRNNYVYLGLPNPLSIVIDGVKQKDLLIKTTDGKVVKSDSKYGYEFTPNKLGRIKLEVYKKGILIDTFILRSKHAPDPVARIGGKNRGTIEKSHLRANAGIVAGIENLDISGSYPIGSYSLMIIRNDSMIFSQRVEGPLFNDSTHKAFSELKNNDKVIVSNIIVNRHFDTTHSTPVELTVVTK